MSGNCYLPAQEPVRLYDVFEEESGVGGKPVQHLQKACEEPDLYFTNGNDVSRWLGTPSVAETSATKGE